MRLFLALLLVASSVAAQVRPFVTAGLSNEHELGYKTPGLLVSAGAEWETAHALTIGSLNWGSGKEQGGGYTLNGKAESNVRIYSGAFAGGGVSCGEVVTNGYRKGSCRPYIQLLLQGNGVRTVAGYIFEGSDGLNELHGAYIGVLYNWTEHLRSGLDFGRYDFVETDTRKSRVGRTWAVKAGWIF